MTTDDLALALRSERKLIDTWLRGALQTARAVPQRLARAMRYAVLGPGKRIRPILTLMTFRASGGRQDQQVAPFCCGIEMIHAFSLAHDDLPSMDDDDLRRGRPSLHRKYDEATAVLAADALFAVAFEMFAGAPVPPARKCAAIDEIARAVGPSGMVGGQLLELESAGRRISTYTQALIQRKKTAELIAASMAVGPLLAGAGIGVADRLRQAGLVLGELFQTTDDLLDAEQSSDFGRPTAVAVRGRSRAENRAKRLAEDAELLLKRVGPRFQKLQQIPGLLHGRTV